MSVKELLFYIEKRPFMYLENKSLQQLYDLVGGFLLAKQIHNLVDEEDKLFTNNFFYWLKDKYKVQNEQNWKNLLLSYYNNDEKRAYESFFNDIKFFFDEGLGLVL